MSTLHRLMRGIIKARARAVLASLSDRQLADIGISRAEIPAHVAKIVEA